MRTPEQRRRHARFDVENVYGRLRSDPRARVLNLSADGLAIETGSWLEVGRSYSIRVQSGDDAMDIDGEVVWCRLVAFRDGSPRYQAGLHFGNALNRSARRVVSFAEETGVTDASRRLFGRWDVPDGSYAEVRGDSRFAVRRLSKSGMLLETEQRPELGSRLAFELELEGQPFRGAALVRNVIESEMGPGGGFLVGAQFVGLERPESQRLERFPSRFEEPPEQIAAGS